MVNNPSRRVRPRIDGIILGGQVLVLGVLVLGLVYTLQFAPRPGTLIYPACVLLTVLFVWSVWSWRVVAQSLFDPYIMFLIAATLFNGGQALLEVFHLNDQGILRNIFPPETVAATLFLVLLGLAALHLGALVSVMVEKRRRPAPGPRTTTRTMQAMRLTSWGLLLISTPFVLLLLRESLGVVWSWGYSELYRRPRTTGFEATPRILASFLTPAVLFLLAGSKGRRGSSVVSGLLLLVYSAVLFFMGSRALAVMPLLAYAWLWHRWIRPVPKTALVAAGLVVLFVIFPLVAAARGTPGSARLSPALLKDLFLSIHNPAIQSVSEMGGSMQTVAYTLELVPSVRPFDLGTGYLYALLTVVPNVAWDVHPTVARGLAANWLVWTVAPGRAATGGGFGFSFIAEAYLNFGWVGSPVILGLIGFSLAGAVFRVQRRRDPTHMAALASYSAFFLIFARGESATVIRPLLWYALLPYLLVRLLAQLRLHPIRHADPAAVAGLPQREQSEVGCGGVAPFPGRPMGQPAGAADGGFLAPGPDRTSDPGLAPTDEAVPD